MRARAPICSMMLAWVVGLPAATAWSRGFGRVPRGRMVLKVASSADRCPGARFTRIQDAIDAARPGATIAVCPGTYAEQLVIAKRVRVVGTGRSVVQPVEMTASTTSLRTGAPIAAAAVVSAGATLDGLEFDLSQNGLTSCDGPLLIGVFFRGTSGGLRNSRVHGVRHAPEAGACDSGAAVLVQGNGTTPTRVDVSGNVIYDYRRAGIVVNERGAHGMIRGNTVTGSGITADVIQNGIQVGFGATASIIVNVVQNNAGPSGADCTFDGGNLVFRANGGFIIGNTFTGNTAGIILNGSSNRVLRNTVDGLSGGTAAGLAGISTFGDGNLVGGNIVRNVSQVGIRVFGDANVANRNAVSETHEATVCAAARALPGCAEVLTVCGVGLWIAGGNANNASRNLLTGNDVDVRDEGLFTVRQRRP